MDEEPTVAIPRALLRLAGLVPLLLLLAACSNFHAIDGERAYRAAQPSEAQLTDWIETHGIRTVLRLRGARPGDPDFEAVRRPVEAAGAHLVVVPMSSRARPSRAQLHHLWHVVDTAEKPLLIHCLGGADRSGLASALYQLAQGRDLDSAREQLAFWPYLHTGWKGAWRMDEVLDEFEPYADFLPFPTWLDTVYEGPEPATPAR